MKDDAYLLDRQQAAERYGMSIRQLEQMYKSHPDFPIIRFGRKVMIHRQWADEWMDDRVGMSIDAGNESAARRAGRAAG